MTYRIFYATGPGDLIRAHKYWAAGEHDPTEVSITFSGQFADFCQDVGAEAYIIARHARKEIYHDGPFTLEHRPKPISNATGLRYHVAEILYGLGLFLTAVRFQAKAAIIDSGCTHYFVLSLFSLARIKTIVVLHNTFWPTGYPPTGIVQKTILKLNAVFFRWFPIATIGVSPECIRQVQQLTAGRSTQLYQIRAQYRREYFSAVSSCSNGDRNPFRIVYVGRIVRDKGVFDILEMAKKVEAQAPARVQWEICGSGPDLDDLRRVQVEAGLQQIVTIRGWTSPADLRNIRASSHVSIVPTRSTFSEGLTLAAIESILAGRPVVTNSANPALEVLRPACVEAKTNDVDSYAKVIVNLLDDPREYSRLCEACPELQEQFYDPGRGLKAALQEIIGPPKEAR